MSCLIFAFLLTTASKLIKIKRVTEFDVIRGGDNLMYEPVNSPRHDSNV